jgi:hypothetical protein
LLFQLTASMPGLVAVALWIMQLDGAAAVAYPLRWRWSNPAPHGGNIVDMAYSPALMLGVQVAERGQIYTSSDLDLWLPRDSKTTDALRAVTFWGTRIVIVGENGRVLYADSVDEFRAGTLSGGSTNNWLEGVAASPFALVAVGDNGAVYTSHNGSAWKSQSSGVTNWLRGAAYGASGFVAVGEQGTIISSRDGTNWVKQSSGTGQHLNRASFASGRYTVVGEAGTILTCTNGVTNWWPEASGATNDLQHTCAGGNTRLVVGDHEVRMNQSGFWSNELGKPLGPPAWTYYANLGWPGFFTIAGRSGMLAEGYATNGLTYFWLTPDNSVRNWLWDVAYLPGLYVAVGDFGTVMSSGNGVGWTLELAPLVYTNSVFLGVGGTTNLLVAVGDHGAIIISPASLSNSLAPGDPGVPAAQTSNSLGVIWLGVPKASTNDLQGVGCLSNQLYVVTGGAGTVLTSSDGTNWVRRTTPTARFLSSVAEWPGGLVATGDHGVILTSPNAVTWTSRTSGTTNWLYRVRYLNGTLIAVGQNGVILTSPNGVNWTARSSGTTKWLNDVTFIDDTWFAVGTGGAVLSSSNLVQWVSRRTITGKSLYGAATDSRQLITVGLEGAILRCQVVPDLTPVSILAYAHVATNEVGGVENVFLFGGKPDQRFTLDYRANLSGAPWVTGAPLEIYDGSGTLYYFETLSGTNQPSSEYYRTTLVP